LTREERASILRELIRSVHGDRSLNGPVLRHKNSDFRYILVAENSVIMAECALGDPFQKARIS
jgi:hypothetical protein